MGELSEDLYMGRTNSFSVSSVPIFNFIQTPQRVQPLDAPKPIQVSDVSSAPTNGNCSLCKLPEPGVSACEPRRCPECIQSLANAMAVSILNMYDSAYPCFGCRNKIRGEHMCGVSVDFLMRVYFVKVAKEFSLKINTALEKAVRIHLHQLEISFQY